MKGGCLRGPTSRGLAAERIGIDSVARVPINSRESMAAGFVAEPGRQDRWHRVHDRLFESACELFLESGYVATTVDEIAVRAGVARKTAFNHYPRKRDLVSEWGTRRRHQVQSAMPPHVLAAPNLKQILQHYFTELGKISVSERALTVSMSFGWRESGGPFDSGPHELLDLFREFTRDAIARGEVPGSIEPARFGSVLYSSYFGLLYDWCDGAVADPPFDLVGEYLTFLDIVLSGVGAI